MPSTATTGPYDLLRFSTWIMCESQVAVFEPYTRKTKELPRKRHERAKRKSEALCLIVLRRVEATSSARLRSSPADFLRYGIGVGSKVRLEQAGQAARRRLVLAHLLPGPGGLQQFGRNTRAVRRN